MGNAWYYRSSGATRGPLSTEELRKLARDGVISAETPVSQEAEGPFQPSARVQNLWPATAASKNNTAFKSKLPVAQRLPAEPATPPACPATVAGPVAGPVGSAAPELANKTSSSPAAANPPVVIPPPPPVAKPPIPPPPPAPFAIPPSASPSNSSGFSLPLNITATSNAGGPANGAPSASHPALNVRRPKQPKALLYAIWGGGGLVLLALAAIFVVAMNASDAPSETAQGSKEKRERKVAASSPQNEEDESTSLNEAPRAGELGSTTNDEPADEKLLAHESAPSQPQAVVVANAATITTPEEKLFGSISQWREGSPEQGVQRDSVTIKIDAIWSGPDVAYRPEWLWEPEAEDDPVFDAAELKGQRGAPPMPRIQGEKIGPLKFLFVRILVGNVGENPFQYSSWNGVEGKPQTAAVLGTPTGHFGRLVPITEAPADDRLAEKTVAPGERISDVLIFEKPAEPPGEKAASLRIALPYAAVELSGQVGFEMPREVLGELPESELAADEPSADPPPGAKSATGGGSYFDALRKAVEGEPAESTTESTTGQAAAESPAAEPSSVPEPTATP